VVPSNGMLQEPCQSLLEKILRQSRFALKLQRNAKPLQVTAKVGYLL